VRIHPNAFKIIHGLSYKMARKVLRSFGCTHSEQDFIIREYKKAYGEMIAKTLTELN
jgi:hypothetical protein